MIDVQKKLDLFMFFEDYLDNPQPQDIPSSEVIKEKLELNEFVKSGEKILWILQQYGKNGGFVPTKVLQQYSASHTRRIKDIRDGKIDGKKHDVRSIFRNNQFGWTYKEE